HKYAGNIQRRIRFFLPEIPTVERVGRAAILAERTVAARAVGLQVLGPRVIDQEVQAATQTLFGPQVQGIVEIVSGCGVHDHLISEVWEWGGGLADAARHAPRPRNLI